MEDWVMSDRELSSARQRAERKEALRQGLQGLERQIYALETAYLEETPSGNVVHGFDDYAANARKNLPKKKVGVARFFCFTLLTR